MKFINEIIKWCDRKPGYSETNAFGSRLICHVNENVKGDYLHVLYKPLQHWPDKVPLPTLPDSHLYVVASQIHEH